MLTLLALVAVCAAHEPVGDDCRRFGIAPQTTWLAGGYNSPVRQYRIHLDNVRCWLAEDDGKDYCTTLFACYAQLEDMANVNLDPPYRDRSARRLKELLGPGDYYFGRLPNPQGPMP